MRDPHEVLGIQADATPEEVRAAYKREIRLYHPDQHGQESDEILSFARERAAEVTAAYRILNDPREYARFQRLQAARSKAQEWYQRARPGTNRGASTQERPPGASETDQEPFDYRRRAASEFTVGRDRPSPSWTSRPASASTRGKRRWWAR